MKELPEVIKQKFKIEFEETVPKIFNKLSQKEKQEFLEILYIYGYRF